MNGTQARIYGFGLWCDRLLEGFAVRIVLSVAILVSLLPVTGMEAANLPFLALFAAELGLRACAVYASTRPLVGEGFTSSPDQAPRRRSAPAAWGLLLVDTLALMSFLPLSLSPSTQWFRVLRLTRMVALAGYWAPILGDLWSTLARRERFRQIALMGVVVGGLSLAGALVLYQVADTPFDADENGTIDGFDSQFLTLLWWAFRQVQDPGNMVESPLAASAVAVSLVLTVFGLFLVSFLIGLGTDVVHEVIALSRTRAPGFRGHTVIINMVPSTRRLLLELWSYYRKLFPTTAPLLSQRWWTELRRRGFSRARYIVVGRQADAPEFLREAALTKVAYRSRPEDEEQLLSRADLVAAKRVLILADYGQPEPDADTIRTLLTLVERVRARERQHGAGPLDRARLVLAEILDDSHVMAARAALATAGRSFRGWVVPTEKLLGVFFAGLVRRPGLGPVAAELLTSSGHELYTCFFSTPGLGWQVARPKQFTTDARQLMASLAQLGVNMAPAGGPVIPIGLLLDAPADERRRDFQVLLNPNGGARLDPSTVRGVVAVADTFRSVGDWVQAWHVDGLPESATAVDFAGRRPPVFARTLAEKGTRVLVCGFRRGTIYLLEELFRSDPEGEVLLLVGDAESRDRAVAAFEAHGQLVDRGLLPGRHGTFVPMIMGEYGVRMPESPERTGRLRLEVADWMASRHLVDLPAGFGHVKGLDAIVLVGEDGGRSDPRITTTLLKLEELCSGDPGSSPHIIAEVFDDQLAARLMARAKELGAHSMQVFSSQELRAFFLFQAVIVPGFDAVWEELLGAWGQSLVHKHVRLSGQGRWSFSELAVRLRGEGEILVGVEFTDADGRTEFALAPGPGQPGGVFEGEALKGVWVIAQEKV